MDFKRASDWFSILGGTLSQLDSVEAKVYNTKPYRSESLNYLLNCRKLGLVRADICRFVLPARGRNKFWKVAVHNKKIKN